MHAIIAERSGPADVMSLKTVDRPEPGATEVLLRVTAAGVNPVDWKSRASGELVSPPWTPGWDIAGVVEEIGSGVTLLHPGDRVFGMPNFPKEAGGYAEYAVSRSRQLAKTPDTLTDIEAAALPLSSLIAYQALIDTAHIRDGSRVLILAAGGGVGHLAVQIAKDHGAYVIGTARERDREYLEGYGLDELIDYTTTEVPDAVRDVDVILGLVAGEPGVQALPALRDGGLFINVPSASDNGPLREKAAGRVEVTDILVEPDYKGMDAIADMAARGALKPRVHRTFPLAGAAQAHAAGEAGQTGGGKLVLVCTDEAN